MIVVLAAGEFSLFCIASYFLCLNCVLHVVILLSIFSYYELVRISGTIFLKIKS